MIKFCIRFCILLAILPLAAAKTSGSPPKEPIALLLDKVIDGDTFIAAGNKIRLWGIDAPESDSPYFLAAKLYLEVILKEAPFECYYKSKDKYQRYVMQCFSKGQDIGAMLVRMGVAEDSKKFSKGLYISDEQFAKENKYGMWK